MRGDIDAFISKRDRQRRKSEGERLEEVIAAISRGAADRAWCTR
jgi:hypothetical protein